MMTITQKRMTSTHAKTIVALTLAIVMNCATSLHAQDLRSSSGNYLGKIESSGTVRSSSGNYLGKIASDGTVRGSSGNYLGKIASDGTVRDSSGNYLGKAQGVDKHKAATVFFFHFFKIQ